MNCPARFLLAGLISLSLAGAFSTAAEEDRQKTLGAVKKELLGKEVVVLGTKASGLERFHGGQEVLLSWHLAEEVSPGIFKSRITSQAPYRYKGQRGVVTAIRLRESPLNPRGTSSTNVFGEAVTDDDVVNPYFEMIVRMPDNSLLSATAFPSTVYLNLELAEVVDAQKAEISQNLNSLVGRLIYPVAYSVVFPSNADLGLMTELQRKLNKLDIPNLSPLKITKAAYIESEHAIVLKVEYGEKSGIVFEPYGQYGRFRQAKEAQRPFIEKAAFGFLTEIPRELSQEEVDAIKKPAVFTGMSKKALHYAVGFPDKENDWGGSGKQLIYFGGRLNVYLRGEKVVDWQSLSR